MKTKRSVIVVLAACVFFVAYEALAFYNPSTSRWLNRDPIVEPPLFALTRSEIGLGDMRLGFEFYGRSTPRPDSFPRSLYAFVENSSLELTDYLGLMTEPGLREWQKCQLPKRWSKKLVGAEVPKPDGCSVPKGAVPPKGTKDDPTGKCSFAKACNNHDLCYSNCRRTRTDCDEKWGREMRAACDACFAGGLGDKTRRDFLLSECRAWADRYKWAVEQWGEKAYETRQKKNCECVCAKCEDPNFCHHPDRKK